MDRQIRRVAVLGSGVMGSAIAAHFANAGIPSLVLDIVPRSFSFLTNSPNSKAGAPTKL